jgi:hypothetical protein
MNDGEGKASTMEFLTMEFLTTEFLDNRVLGQRSSRHSLFHCACAHQNKSDIVISMCILPGTHDARL